MSLLELDFIDMQVELDAPVEEVFAFFLQLERWSSWASGIRRAFRKSDHPWREGFRLGFVPDFLPVPIVTKVIGYEENRLVEWGMRTPAGSVIHRFEFEPMGDGRCRVRQVEAARGLPAILMRPLKGRIESFDRGLAEDLQEAVRKGFLRA